MIRSILVFLLCSFLISAKSQQAPLYNQYHIAPLIYNPAYTGYNNKVDISLIRNQRWGNYGEGFNANSLSVGTTLKGEKHAIGVNLYSDYIGITSKLTAHLLYAYRLKLGENMGLRFGLAAGVIDNRIDFSNIVVTDPNDPMVINALSDRQTMFDMNFGINFNYKELRFGVSVPQLLGTKLYYSDDNLSFYTLERQLVTNLGYSWYINKEKGILINPEALVIYSFPGAPIQYNVNLFFELEKIAWIGAGYKSDYAATFSLGVNLVKNLKLGLSYDYIINSVATYSSKPNAEIILKYSIPPRVEQVQDNSEYEKMLAEQQRKIDSLNAVNQQSRIEIDKLEDENQFLEDSLAKWPKNVVTNPPLVDSIPTGYLPSNPQDYFVELNGNDTPNGYFVITGAFAQKSNADALVRKIKPKYPNARIILNKRNNLYYVLLYHSSVKDESLAYESFKAKSNLVEETWVLSYTRPEK